MTIDKAEIGRDDMEIDTVQSEHPQENAVPDGFDANYLKLYYGKLFPHADFCKWMSYGNDGKHPACDQSYLGRREFSYTLQSNTSNEEFFLRYQSFNNGSELENSIKEKCPLKIDIGPVYNVDPAKRRAYEQGAGNGFTAVERELVFDIDISDYDDVRYCCSGADVCLDCWPLMTVAIKVVDTSLRDDFGFDHILWAYSGRRGVHCWVCDGKARKLSNEQRAAIVDYFRVYKGNENSIRKVSLPGAALHPFLSRSYSEVLKIFFEEKLVTSQKLFSHPERFEKILEMIPDQSIASELRGKWDENRRSSISEESIDLVRWGQLKHLLQSGKNKGQGLRRCIEEIVFSYTFPRLDVEVSKRMDHLLKAPFCIHPKTGRVCVPIDPTHCEEFDPTTVPTVSQGGFLTKSIPLVAKCQRDDTLMGELNMGGIRAADNDDLESNTSLGEYIRYFRTSFLQPLLKSCKEDNEKHYSAKLRDSKNSLSW